MHIKSILFTLFILVLSEFLAAQTKNEENGGDNGFPQPTGQIEEFFKDGKATCKDNALKMDFSGLVRGNVAVSYERKIIEQLSVEIVGGIKLFNGLSLWMLADGVQGGEVNPLSSPVWGLNIKYYNNGGALDRGTYYGVSMFNESMVFKSPVDYNGSLWKNDQVTEVKLTCYRFSVGAQTLLSNKIAFDIGTFAGFAIGNIHYVGEYLQPTFGMDYGLVIKSGIYF